MIQGKRAAIAASRFALVVSLLFGCTGRSGASGSKTEPAPGALRVLFIGNSLTYGNDLPQLVQALAKAAGQEMFVESLTFPNYSLDDHWSHGAAPKAIASRQWDYVVLQHGPATMPDSRAAFRAAVKDYDRDIRKAGARPAFYMVWPPRDRISYFDAVRESYSLAAQDVDGVFIPAGEVWRAAWKRDPDAPLYAGDDFHPSVAGSYAAALSIYGMLTGRSPEGLPSRLALETGQVVEVPAALAKLLQESAAEANKTYGRR